MEVVPGKNFTMLGLSTFALKNTTAHVLSRNGEFRPHPFLIRISNMTKDVTWIYSPTFFGVPKTDENVVWSSFWTFRNQMEGGDEIHVSIVVEDDYEKKKRGTDFIYDEPSHYYYPASTNKMVVKLFNWHIRGKTYFFGSLNSVSSTEIGDVFALVRSFLFDSAVNKYPTSIYVVDA